MSRTGLECGQPGDVPQLGTEGNPGTQLQVEQPRGSGTDREVSWWWEGVGVRDLEGVKLVRFIVVNHLFIVRSRYMSRGYFTLLLDGRWSEKL